MELFLYLLRKVFASKNREKKIEKYLLDKKNSLLRAEKQVVLKNERLPLLENILLQNPTYYFLNPLKRST